MRRHPCPSPQFDFRTNVERKCQKSETAHHKPVYFRCLRQWSRRFSCTRLSNRFDELESLCSHRRTVHGIRCHSLCRWTVTEWVVLPKLHFVELLEMLAVDFRIVYVPSVKRQKWRNLLWKSGWLRGFFGFWQVLRAYHGSLIGAVAPLLRSAVALFWSNRPLGHGINSDGKFRTQFTVHRSSCLSWFLLCRVHAERAL